MNFEYLMVNKRSHKQKVIYFIILLNEMSRISKSIKTKSRLVFAGGWGED